MRHSTSATPAPLGHGTPARAATTAVATKTTLPQRRPEPAAPGHGVSQWAARAAAEAAVAELEVLAATERTRKAVKALQAADAELAAARVAEREKRIAWNTATAKAAKQTVTAAPAAQLAADCVSPPPEDPSPKKNAVSGSPSSF